MSRLLVTQYQAEVEKIVRYGGSKKETSIRNAFEQLLTDYCKPRNYLLIQKQCVWDSNWNCSDIFSSKT
jgi:hypothetical protein